MTPLVSPTLLSSEIHVEQPVQMCITPTNESKVEETKGVTIMVDDVKNPNFQRAISVNLERRKLLFG